MLVSTYYVDTSIFSFQVEDTLLEERLYEVETL